MQEENKNKKSFHQGMKAELKKVIWPTGKQVVKSTSATICFVLLISVILIILNYAFSFLNTKWYDLVLGNNKPNQNIEQNIIHSGDVISGDAISGDENHSGDALLSGDNEGNNTDVTSGE